MTADHETSERVYTALKADLLAGGFAPGRLQITLLETRYSASATPVREALLRLVGEGLVEMRSTGGFACPSLDEQDVRDLYEASLRLTLLAVAWRSASGAAEGAAPSGRDLEPPIDVLLAGLARGADNPVFSAIIESINDRMCRIRQVEQWELGGLNREFANLDVLVRTGPEAKLRRAVHGYHRRRLDHASGIARRIALRDAEHLHQRP